MNHRESALTLKLNLAFKLRQLVGGRQKQVFRQRSACSSCLLTKTCTVMKRSLTFSLLSAAAGFLRIHMTNITQFLRNEAHAWVVYSQEDEFNMKTSDIYGFGLSDFFVKACSTCDVCCSPDVKLETLKSQLEFKICYKLVAANYFV